MKNISNWLTTSKFPDKKCYWRGQYSCDGCDQIFTARIHKYNALGQNLELTISWIGFTCSTRMTSKRKRVVGDERDDMKKRIAVDGIQNVYSQLNLIGKRIEKSVLEKMKSEFMHRYRISNDLIIDIAATKRNCDSALRHDENLDITGYIQRISYDPFGYLMISGTTVQFELFS